MKFCYYVRCDFFTVEKISLPVYFEALGSVKTIDRVYTIDVNRRVVFNHGGFEASFYKEKIEDPKFTNWVSFFMF